PTSYAPSRLITRTRTIISDIKDIAGSILTPDAMIIVTLTELREEATGVPVISTGSARNSRFEPTKETTPALEPVRIKGLVPAPGVNAWISGPVLGSICAILLVLICFWFVRRRRRENLSLPTAIGHRANDKHEKPELHANHVAREPPVEIGGSYPVPVPEMGANEVSAQEMLVSTTVAEMPERHTCKLSLLLFPKWTTFRVCNINVV
ncbi:nonsense-mediated mrna decay protein, partial [Colletotrichum asianum]